jgi:hypothetical protein
MVLLSKLVNLLGYKVEDEFDLITCIYNVYPSKCLIINPGSGPLLYIEDCLEIQLYLKEYFHD